MIIYFTEGYLKEHLVKAEVLSLITQMVIRKALAPMSKFSFQKLS